MTATPEASQDKLHRRADAVRNAAAVLDAAAHVLIDNPAATIPDIAAASGLARATIYRHFPNREDLFHALLDRALLDVEAAFDAARLDTGPVLAAVERLIEVLVTVGDRYRYLLVEGRKHPSTGDRADMQGLERSLMDVVERGQRSGEIRLDVPATWLVSVIGQMVEVGLREMSRRGYGPQETVRLIVATLRDGLRGPARG
jgi:TetR/AcrR family transcriptional repressor of mexCD-oprJ operon